MPTPSASLAWLISTHKGLAISCETCAHTKTQDILAMAVRHGETTTLDQLRPKLARCPRCGGKARFDVWTKPDEDYPSRPT